MSSPYDKLPENPRILIWNGVSDPRQLKTKMGREKVSLREQSSTGHTFVEKMNGLLVAEFFWDGESRWESDLEKALEDFAKQDRYQYHQLRDLWRKRGFDVLHCYHHSRLGRSFTLQSWVVENVVRSGALIYEHLGGWIDENNYPGKIAINGFSNVSEIRRFTSMTTAARKERPRRGLYSVRPPFTHLAEYDPLTGEQIRTIVNPEYRQMMLDLATLIIERVGWAMIPKALYERFGHLNPRTGNMYAAIDLHRLIHHPIMWGHLMETNLYGDNRSERSVQLWQIDASMEPPKGEIIHRNKCEPIFSGDLATRLLAELHRRPGIKGKAVTGDTRMFSGLCFCAECLYRMRTATNSWKSRFGRKSHTYIECVTGTRNKAHGIKMPCSNRTAMRTEVLQAHIDQLLHTCIEIQGGIEAVFSPPDTNDGLQRLKQIEGDITREERRIRALIAQRADAPESLSAYYVEALRDADAKLKIMQSDAAQLRIQQSDYAKKNTYRAEALNDIRLVLDRLWTLPEGEINQLLHAFFIDYRFYILDGKIVRFAPAPPPIPKKRRSKS